VKIGAGEFEIFGKRRKLETTRVNFETNLGKLSWEDCGRGSLGREKSGIRMKRSVAIRNEFKNLGFFYWWENLSDAVVFNWRVLKLERVSVEYQRWFCSYRFGEGE